MTSTDPQTPVPSPSVQPAAASAEQGSVGALVCGILALITAPFLIGLVLGLVAIYLGGRHAPRAGISRAGRILGIVAVVLTVVLAIARGAAAVNG